MLISTLINDEVEPEYAIVESLNKAAAEWFPGIETFDNTLPIITASRNVHVCESANGRRIPL